jgi:hypothetical protein
MEESKRLQLLAERLKEQESILRNKAAFCNEHKFHREEEWIRQRLNIIQEIRFEVELIETAREYDPKFYF